MPIVTRLVQPGIAAVSQEAAGLTILELSTEALHLRQDSTVIGKMELDLMMEVSEVILNISVNSVFMLQRNGLRMRT